MSNAVLKADDFAEAAEEFFSNNQNKEAIKMYLNSILMKRFNPKAYKGLGKSYRNLKQYDKAIDAFEKAKRITPCDAEIYSELGICYLAENDFEKAVKNFIKAIKINPENPDTQIQLAITHEVMGEEDMALMIYQKITETAPEYKKAYIQKATLLMKLERFEEAIDVFLLILKLDAEYHRAFLGLGICFDKINQGIQAKKFYKKFLKAQPSSINTGNIQNRLYFLTKANSVEKNLLKIV